MRPRLDRSHGRRLFGLDPETYDAARPGHAEDLYELLRERCGLRPGAKVLEVGPGTGQATARLLELGAAPLVGLEPDPLLADFLRARFGDRIALRPTALEDAELETDFDLAVAASCFHWVEEGVGLARLHDALRPGGRVALWWTLFGDDDHPDSFISAVDPLFAEVPTGPSAAGEGRPAFALDTEHRLAALREAGFERPEHDRIPWISSWDAAGIRSLYSTFSPILALEPDRRAQLLDAVERIAADEFGGRVEKHLVTSLYTASKPS